MVKSLKLNKSRKNIVKLSHSLQAIICYPYLCLSFTFWSSKNSLYSFLLNISFLAGFCTFPLFDCVTAQFFVDTVFKRNITSYLSVLHTSNSILLSLLLP